MLSYYYKKRDRRKERSSRVWWYSHSLSLPPSVKLHPFHIPIFFSTVLLGPGWCCLRVRLDLNRSHNAIQYISLLQTYYIKVQ